MRTAIHNAGLIPALVLLGACGAIGDSLPAASKAGAADADHPETGLQGQVPLADQLSGRAAQGYWKNVRVLGKNNIGGRGTNMHMAWLDDCAYLGDVSTTADDVDGLAVVDVSDPTNPTLVKTFPGIGGMQPSTVHANAARRMIVAKGTGSIHIFAVGSDCTDPQLVGQYEFASMPHEFQITQDGMTFWGSTDLNALDLSDMTNPEPIAYTVDGGATVGGHDLDLSPDGTRAYVGANGGNTRIVDVSEIQQRKPNPVARVINQNMPLAEWHTISIGHINGRKYMFTSGETVVRSACPWMGLSSPNQHGAIVTYDITDENNPQYVSTFKLEVNDVANCPLTIPDNANYSPHFGNVDDPENTTMVFNSWYHAGERIIDVRDPYHPVEIGYYNAANWGEPRQTGGDKAQILSGTYSYVRYRPESRQIWFEDMYEGLVVLELKNPPAGSP